VNWWIIHMNSYNLICMFLYICFSGSFRCGAWCFKKRKWTNYVQFMYKLHFTHTKLSCKIVTLYHEIKLEMLNWKTECFSIWHSRYRTPQVCVTWWSCSPASNLNIWLSAQAVTWSMSLFDYWPNSAYFCLFSKFKLDFESKI